MKLPWHS